MHLFYIYFTIKSSFIIFYLFLVTFLYRQESNAKKLPSGTPFINQFYGLPKRLINPFVFRQNTLCSQLTYIYYSLRYARIGFCDLGITCFSSLRGAKRRSNPVQFPSFQVFFVIANVSEAIQ